MHDGRCSGLKRTNARSAMPYLLQRSSAAELEERCCMRLCTWILAMRICIAKPAWSGIQAAQQLTIAHHGNIKTVAHLTEHAHAPMQSCHVPMSKLAVATRNVTPPQATVGLLCYTAPQHAWCLRQACFVCTEMSKQNLHHSSTNVPRRQLVMGITTVASLHKQVNASRIRNWHLLCLKHFKMLCNHHARPASVQTS
eukprot:2075681-Amphidinium_carterae.2